jgi:hypothetical protein
MSELKVEEQNSDEILEDISNHIKGPIRIIGNLIQILSNHIENQDLTMAGEIIPRIEINVKNLYKIFKLLEKNYSKILLKDK